jgi:gentisate 1,2-dioxygenase
VNFYDRWLGLWDEAEAERAKSRRVIHYEELDWTQTPQDARVALLVAPETGFRTWGSESLRGEIPPGWHSGAHKHGEEVMYIVAGEGFSIVDGIRYEWQAGSTIAIPFGAVHQHFNTGPEPVVFVAAMAVHFEHFVGIHRTVQLENCGPTGRLPDAERSPGGLAPDGKRITLRWEDSELIADKRSTPVTSRVDAPQVLGTVAGMDALMQEHHLQRRRFMQINTGRHDFDVNEIEISSLMSDAPRTRGGRHAHMEAHIHFLSGHGYSLLGEEKERVPWKTGSTIHIIGPQTIHQHVNESGEPSRMLRIAPGIRYFVEQFANREFPYVYLEGKSAL